MSALPPFDTSRNAHSRLHLCSSRSYNANVRVPLPNRSRGVAAVANHFSTQPAAFQPSCLQTFANMKVEMVSPVRYNGCNAQFEVPEQMRKSKLPTERQSEVHRTIARLTKEAGIPPTLQEIGRACDPPLSGTRVREHLEALHAQGLATYDPTRNRTARVTAPLPGRRKRPAKTLKAPCFDPSTPAGVEAMLARADAEG